MKCYLRDQNLGCAAHWWQSDRLNVWSGGLLFCAANQKIGGQLPITHPLFIFCANNTSLFVLQISLSNLNFDTGPSISNITQYLIFPKPDLSKKFKKRWREISPACHLSTYEYHELTKWPATITTCMVII